MKVNVAFGREIVLKNVKLKESALRDAGLPLRYCISRCDSIYDTLDIL